MPLFLLDNWVVTALFSAALWALSCVIDVCFVGKGIYRDASDGVMIAGLFCIVPAVCSSGSMDFAGTSWAVVAIGALTGLVFLAHVYFYFAALFSLNDAVNAEIFNTLGVLVVPVLAFVLLGERLSWMNYAAIGMAVAGLVVLIGLQRTRLTGIALTCLAASVAAVSFMMVMQAWVLQLASYATLVWLFSTSAFSAALFATGAAAVRRRRVGYLFRRFGVLFIVVQLLELGAILGSQRATDLSPSVSLVALLECSLPVFVMIFSGLIAATARHWRTGRSQQLLAALARQSRAAPSKIASMALIVAAIALVNI